MGTDDRWWIAPLLVVLGAAVALFGQFILEHWRESKRRTVILLALEEELRAVAFKPGSKYISGFTSQTFDELFADIAALLPPVTARRVIRYHLRMKHLDGIYRVMLTEEAVREMESLRDELVSEVRRRQPRQIRGDG